MKGDHRNKNLLAKNVINALNELAFQLIAGFNLLEEKDKPDIEIIAPIEFIFEKTTIKGKKVLRLYLKNNENKVPIHEQYLNENDNENIS